MENFPEDEGIVGVLKVNSYRLVIKRQITQKIGKAYEYFPKNIDKWPTHPWKDTHQH